MTFKPSRRGLIKTLFAAFGLQSLPASGKSVEKCGECGGTGLIVNDGPRSPCYDCNGTGFPSGEGGKQIESYWVNATGWSNGEVFTYRFRVYASNKTRIEEL